MNKMRAIWAIIRGGAVVYRAQVNGRLTVNRPHSFVRETAIQPD